MSLKIEQRLDDLFFTETEPRIYSTGVYLVPMEIKRGKKKMYVWVVDEFHDDTYLCPTAKDCSPRVLAKTIGELLNLSKE